MAELSETQAQLKNHLTKMDKLNARNRKKQHQQAEAAARAAILRQRPSWELMRLTETVTIDDENSGEPPVILTSGSLVLRVNTKAMLHALYWPHHHDYNYIPGLAFFEKSAGKFDAEKGFTGLDSYLEPATDADAALPRKCLACGKEAHNRGLFCAEEPVFFCDTHHRKEYPLYLPGDGFRESERPDRT